MEEEEIKELKEITTKHLKVKDSPKKLNKFCFDLPAAAGENTVEEPKNPSYILCHNSSVGASIASCFHQQKLGMSTHQAIKARPLDNFSLKSPRLLQNKLTQKTEPKNFTMNKCSEYKSTTEGSWIDDRMRGVQSSIMDNYLNWGANMNKTNSFMSGRNMKYLPTSSNGNQTISAYPMAGLTTKKRKQKGISALSMSLIGSMIKNPEQLKQKYPV